MLQRRTTYVPALTLRAKSREVLGQYKQGRGDVAKGMRLGREAGDYEAIKNLEDTKVGG